MTDQEFSTYLKDRYATILKYYDDRSKHYKSCHMISSIYVLVVSVLITPILTISLPAPLDGKTIVAILAPTVAIVSGIAALFHFHENWISFRATWDALQHEVHWRDAKVGEYSESDDRNALFVSRVESLISQEGVQWYALHGSKEPKK